MWAAVLLACAAAYGLKLAGYLVPPHWMSGERTARVSGLLPVALLAGLVVVQSVTGDGGRLEADARLVAVGVAFLLLMLRANFLVVVVAAAVTAAGLRALGWG